MSRRPSGNNGGTAYLGVGAITPPNQLILRRDPTVNDVNHDLGTRWLNRDNKNLWYLSNFFNTTPPPYPPRLQANWVLLSEDGGTVTELTSNTGGAVPPDNGNINTIGDNIGITGVGNPATNTITFSLIGGGIAAQSFPTGAGVSTTSGTTAVPTALGVLNVLGAHNVLTGGAVANTVTVFGTNTITLGDLATVAAGSPAATLTTGDIQLNDKNGAVNGEGIAKIRFWPAVTGQDYNDIYFYLNNVFMGQSAGNQTMTPTQAIFNVGIGSKALQSLTTGAQNIAIGGSGALEKCTTGVNNTAIGYAALNELTTGARNIAVGDGSLQILTTGDDNLAIGNSAGSVLTTEKNNLLVNATGSAGIDGFLNVSMKFRNILGPVMHNWPGDSSTNGSNFFVGYGCGNFSLGNTSVKNIGFGSEALLNIATTAVSNTAVGFETLRLMTTGKRNTAIGDTAGYSASGLSGLTTGSDNIFVGQLAGSTYNSSESSNIMIGSDGVVGESNTTRIGRGTGTGASQQNRCFVSGIRGITTDVNDAIPVLIDSAGQLGTVSSSIRYKKNVRPLDDISSKIYGLQPVKFQYKTDLDQIDRYGLIAEQVHEVMPEIVIYNEDGDCETVRYHDLAPLLLAEIIKLNKRIEQLEKK